MSPTFQKSDDYAPLVDFAGGQLWSMADPQALTTMPGENNYKGFKHVQGVGTAHAQPHTCPHKPRPLVPVGGAVPGPCFARSMRRSQSLASTDTEY